MIINTDETNPFALVFSLLQVIEEAGFAARLVGGCVRDKLLGLAPKDYDVATDALPEEVMTVLSRGSIKVRTLPTGLKHGTVTALLQNLSVEITTLRRDIATHGRRADVAFGKDFRADAARRDFTINAMSMDRHGRVFDYFSGQEHLRQRLVVFVGDAQTRIQEDYLRIMRSFRFQARFGFHTTPDALEAIKDHRQGLVDISAERLTSEWLQIFAEASFLTVLPEMIHTGVYEMFFPTTTEGLTLSLQDLYQEIFPRLLPPWKPLAGLTVPLLLHSLVQENPNAQAAVLVSLKLSKRLLHGRTALVKSLWDLASLTKATPAQIMERLDRLEQSCGENAWEELAHPLWQGMSKIAGEEPKLKLLTIGLSHTEEVLRKNGHRRLAKLPLSTPEVQKILAINGGKILGEALLALRNSYRDGLWSSAKEGALWLERWKKRNREK